MPEGIIVRMKRSNFRKEKSGISLLITGTVLSFGALLVCAMLFSFLLSLSSDPIPLIGLGGMGAMILCSLFSSALIASKRKEGGVSLGMLTALMLCLILFIIGVLITRKVETGVLISLGIYLLASFPGSLIGAKVAKKRRIRA